jgi:hypothetical protein
LTDEPDGTLERYRIWKDRCERLIAEIAARDAAMNYDSDVGYGIRVKEHEAEGQRPAGSVVEIHFYDRSKAVEFTAQLIRTLAAQNERLSVLFHRKTD